MYWHLLYKCIFKDANMIQLSSEQCATFCTFMMMLSSSGKKSIIARGDSDENLLKHYNVDTSDPQILAQYIFKIGAKGRLCLYHENGIDPDDTTTDNFSAICRHLKYALKNADHGTTPRSTKMKNFISRNKCFYDGILNDGSKLISRYNKLSTCEKRDINIYYLYILHTINSHRYSKISNFVSTSINTDVADGFARNILILGWTPLSRPFSTVSFNNNDIYRRCCKSHNLPHINTPVYPEQAEIALRCGILPHFIIGFRIKNDFYVNPAIFETMELFSKCQSNSQIKQLREDIINHGLKVDQSKFVEYCKMTNYKKYFTFHGLQYRNYTLP